MVHDAVLRLSAEAPVVRMYSSEKIGPGVKRVPLGDRRVRILVPPARIDVPGVAQRCSRARQIELSLRYRRIR